MNNYNINLYSTENEIPAVVHTVQIDKGRNLICNIADMEIPEESTAVFFAVKPSGKGVYNDATISGNTVEVELTAQTLAEVGTIHAQVQIKNDEDYITTFAFLIENQATYSGDSISSDDESTYLERLLNGMQQQVDEAVDNAEEATENANTAADNANTAADNANTATANSINQQQLFEEWFEYIKGQLSEDAAGNLQLQCMELNERLSLLEYMTMQNDFSAPLATDDEDITLIIDDLDYAILAEWKHKEV